MKKIILLLATVAFCVGAKADSPLTSTNFFTVYEEYEIVNEALAAKGKLTNNLMLYLSNRAFPIDIKMAVINALGWNFYGQKNFDAYLDFLEMRSGLERNQEVFYKKMDADELLCLAYLKAMDNYFDVKDAKTLAEAAVEKSRRSRYSYTFQLINALIGAQQKMEGNWCRMYQLTNAVRTNSTLDYDFPPEADKIVFDYMELYKAECN